MNTAPTLPGIHHVTAITADAQKNVDFYCGVLGLRLVKRTVNFDDPKSYHLYYGDELGRPGTIMTFFAWPGGHPGRIGPPQVTTTAFAVPLGSLPFWSKHLADHGIEQEQIFDRFGEQVLAFTDPDQLRLELVASTNTAGHASPSSIIPAEHAIRGFHSVTLSIEGYEKTARLLRDIMGFRAEGNEGNRFRYRSQSADGFASIVDLLCVPDSRRGGMGSGVVHHVAFRTPDDAQQEAWHCRIIEEGFNASPVMDRNYFHSIYFREPGGVLFEIATDAPGFTIDEPADQLGQTLKLPHPYERLRDSIQQSLPPLQLPGLK